MSELDTILDGAALAKEIAARASTIVPPSVSVRAEGDRVLIAVRDDPPSGIQMFQSPERSIGDLARLLAYNVLNSLQDIVVRETTEPWPIRGRGVPMAQPRVAIRDGELHMWYGDEATIVLALKSIPLTGVLTNPRRPSPE